MAALGLNWLRRSVSGVGPFPQGAPVLDCAGRVVAIVSNLFTGSIGFMSRTVRFTTAWGRPNVVSVPVQALRDFSLRRMTRAAARSMVIERPPSDQQPGRPFVIYSFAGRLLLTRQNGLVWPQGWPQGLNPASTVL